MQVSLQFVLCSFAEDYVIIWKKLSDDDNGSPNILAVGSNLMVKEERVKVQLNHKVHFHHHVHPHVH